MNNYSAIILENIAKVLQCSYQDLLYCSYDEILLLGNNLLNIKDIPYKERQQNLREESFRRSMSIAGRSGIQFDKEDIPQSEQELSKLSDAAKDYEMLITAKLEKHIPEDMLLKSALVDKERELITEIKAGELTKAEGMKARAKLVEIEKQLIQHPKQYACCAFEHSV